jgi:hypothetical protein
VAWPRAHRASRARSGRGPARILVRWGAFLTLHLLLKDKVLRRSVEPTPKEPLKIVSWGAAHIAVVALADFQAIQPNTWQDGWIQNKRLRE